MSGENKRNRVGMREKLDVDLLGQVFTESSIVKRMIGLRRRHGTILEPSCGAGAFFNEIEGCVGIEYDSRVCPKGAFNMDFFDFSESNKFDTIIGNPPYVRFQGIAEDTKSKLNMGLFDKRTNLYLFFMEKCIRHLNDGGELIFIVPRDFIKATSAIRLNKLMFENGTITDWIDLGDEMAFPGFSPNCAIFRFEKGDFSRVANGNLRFVENDGHLAFLNGDSSNKFSNHFFVKVGAASGSDKLFESENGNVDFVCSKTIDSGETKRMHYNRPHPELEAVKGELLNRKLKNFGERNWYMWGRGYYESESPRIYVNAKTRRSKPFFVHPCKAYDGSVLAVFPKFEIKDGAHLESVCEALNSVNWNELGFKCGGRLLFSQRSLESSALPDDLSFAPAN